MKKLLFISNICNGISNFIIPSIEACKELGYEFHIAADFSSFKESTLEYDIKMHQIDLNRNPFSFQNIKAYKQVIELIEKEQFDAIHCNTPIGGVFGRLAGRKKKISPILYTAHGFHFYKGAPIANDLIFKNAERFMARYTDALITINHEDYKAAHEFKMRKSKNVYYIPGVGIDTEEYNRNIDKIKSRKELNLTEENIVLIAMGDLIYRKNYVTSLKAIKHCNNTNLQFLICGEGPEKMNLKNLAKELGIEKQIHFLGYRTDIKELLALSDIFLFSTLQEGLPRSMMESMAAGLPCIASKIRGNTELIEHEHGGYLIDPNDIQGFSTAISTLSKDENLRKEFSQINKANIKKFDTSRVKKTLKEIYEKELL